MSIFVIIAEIRSYDFGKENNGFRSEFYYTVLQKLRFPSDSVGIKNYFFVYFEGVKSESQIISS